MKTISTLLFILSLSIGLRAQTKLTDFVGGRKVSVPFGSQKIGVVNDRFTFVINDGSQYGFWSTDGTVANTKLLLPLVNTDFLICDPAYKTLTFGKQQYTLNCRGDKLVQSDGITASAVLSNVNEVFFPQKINDELYAVVDPSLGTASDHKLYKLTQDGKSEVITQNFDAFTFTEKGLFYVQPDAAKAFNDLYFYDGKTTAKIKQHSVYSTFQNQLQVTIVDNRAVIATNAVFPASDVIIYDIAANKILNTAKFDSNNANFNFTKDELGNAYLMRDAYVSGGNQLELYRLEADNSLALITAFPSETLTSIISMSLSGYHNVFLPAYIANNQLVFAITNTGTGGGTAGFVTDYKVGSYNLKTNILKNSKTLLGNDGIYVKMYGLPTLKPAGAESIMVEDVKGRQLTYNFQKETSAVTPGPEIKSDSVAMLGKQRLIVKDNVFQEENGTRTPLIQPRKTFYFDDKFAFVNKEIAGKLLLFRSGPDNYSPGLLVASVNGANQSEEILNLPGEILAGYKGEGVLQSGNKIYFLTQKLGVNTTNATSIYVSDGNKETTRIIGSLPPNLYLQKAVANSNELLFLLESSTAPKEYTLLKITGDKVVVISSEIVSSDILATSTKLYLLKSKTRFGNVKDMLVVNDDKLQIVAENTFSHLAVNNAVVYTKYQADRETAVGIYVYANGNEKMIAPAAYTKYKKLDDSRVAVYSADGSSVIIYNINDDKEVGKFGQAGGVKIDVKVVNNAVVIAEGQQITIQQTDKQTVVKLDNAVKYSAIRPLEKGFMILSNIVGDTTNFTQLSYYDLQVNELRNVETPVTVRIGSVNSDKNYILFRQDVPKASTRYENWFWDETMKSIEPIGLVESQGYFGESAGRVVYERMSYDFDAVARIWYHSPGKFELIERVENKDMYLLLRETSAKTPLLFSYSKLPDLSKIPVVQYTKSGKTEFPIIRGSDGGYLTKSVFTYNGQFYTYGFTLADGFQVWHLGKITEENADYPKVVALAKEVSALQVNVFPNPTSEIITISTILPVEVSLLTVTGQKISTHEPKSTHQISIKDLPSGMYLLEINDGKLRTVKKVAKQ